MIQNQTLALRFEQAQSQARRDRVKADPFRLDFHLMPPAGWMNDPNGLCQFKGIHHIFYQYAPQSCLGDSPKGWGHYSTKDFIHYQEEKIPLIPDSAMDENGAYSGSALVNGNKITFFYTGNGKEKGDFDYINKGRRHWTCSFESTDGFDFSQKETLMTNADYPADLSCHVRDPKVIQRGSTFYMVQGARTRTSRGLVQVFESEDLKHWQPVSRISSKQHFGYMWECPDVFDLDGQSFLITCPQGAEEKGPGFENVYLNGYFEIRPDLSKNQCVSDFTPLDYGFDFYAPQSYEDESGRRILIGWMGIPDAGYSNPTVQNGWQHALTLPRQLWNVDGKLYQYPIEEIKELRLSCIRTLLHEDEPFPLPQKACELQIHPDQNCWTIQIGSDACLEYENGILSLSMKQSGSGRQVRHMDIESIGQLSIFMDRSSMEIFVNGGQKAMTTRIYDLQEHPDIICSCSMAAEIYPLAAFEIKERILDERETI